MQIYRESIKIRRIKTCIKAAKSGKFDRVRRLKAKFSLVFYAKFEKIPTGV